MGDAELDELKRRVLRRIDGLRPEMERISADIHANPELGFEEVRASGWLSSFLADHGFAVDRGVAELPTAFRAERRGGEGPTVALLAEYDALPGLGHGCGHNLIGTASCAAAIAVGEEWPQAPGTVAVMGTPAEEGGGGKILMLERGAFDGVDLSMMFHPSYLNQINTPSLAAGNLTFRFHGKPAHSAVHPHLGVNAADAAMLLFAGVNALRQHVTSDVRLHGIIQEAGDKANIVPELSVVEFMVRADRREYMEELIERVLDVARGAALMTGCSVEAERGLTYFDARHCPSLGDVARANFELVGIREDPLDARSPKASGDGGNVSHAVPHLGITLAIADHPIAGHSVEWREAAASPFGADAMVGAAKVLALSVCDALADPALLERAREEHRAAVGG